MPRRNRRRPRKNTMSTHAPSEEVVYARTTDQMALNLVSAGLATSWILESSRAMRKGGDQ